MATLFLPPCIYPVHWFISINLALKFGTGSQICFVACLLQVEVKEGFLVCPETGRQFPITNGIPNMLLNEEEVS